MKKGIRIGLVTAAVAAAIGFLTLYPRPANAAVMWAEMAKASQGIRAVHIVNVWYLQNGEKGRTEIWTDGHEIRIEPSKTQLLTGEEAGVQESTEVFATSNGIDPATFMVSEQIKMLGAGAHEPEDRGTIKQGRKTYRMISIVNQRGDMRHTFWVDEGSDLPVRKVDDEWSNGKWVEVGYQSFEFMDSMPSKNPPPAKKG